MMQSVAVRVSFVLPLHKFVPTMSPTLCQQTLLSGLQWQIFNKEWASWGVIYVLVHQFGGVRVREHTLLALLARSGS